MPKHQLKGLIAPLIPPHLGQATKLLFLHGHTPSPAVLESLLSVTKTIFASVIGKPHFGKSYAVNLNHTNEELQDLARRVTIHLELINVAK